MGDRTELLSVLTCPECGHSERLAMPTDACVFFHECAGCHARLRPRAGDCCVFCSYGSVPCPPVQAGNADCCAPPAEAPAKRGKARLADAAGVTGAVIAALCCAGTPLIVGALAAAGLSSLRRDAVLWPVMLASLAVALWGFWQGRTSHGKSGPLLLGAVGAVALACGVIVVHGPPAMTVIYGGSILLVIATLWNILARRRAACSPAA